MELLRVSIVIVMGFRGCRSKEHLKQRTTQIEQQNEDRIKLTKLHSYMNIEGHPNWIRTTTKKNDIQRYGRHQQHHFLFNSNKKHPRLKRRREQKSYWNYTSFFYIYVFLDHQTGMFYVCSWCKVYDSSLQ